MAPSSQSCSFSGEPKRGQGWVGAGIMSITVSELHPWPERGTSTLQLGSQEDRGGRAWGECRRCEALERKVLCVIQHHHLHLHYHRHHHHHHHHNNITTTTNNKGNFSLLSSDHTSGIFHTRNPHNSISRYLSLLLEFTDEDPEAQRV